MEVMGKRVTCRALIQNTVNVTIIDAMFLLHLMPTSLPATFGSVAEHMLRTICKFQGSIIHFVSDKTISPSIKDAERESKWL